MPSRKSPSPAGRRALGLPRFQRKMCRLAVRSRTDAGRFCLLLPPQNAAAGHLVLSRGPLTLAPENECHLLCVQLTGRQRNSSSRGFPRCPSSPGARPARRRQTDGAPCRRAGRSERVRSQLAFALLCELSDADSAAPALPPLVAAAIEDIRKNYAGLYGVEELSERLGVSKSHLVRPLRRRWASRRGGISPASA